MKKLELKFEALMYFLPLLMLVAPILQLIHPQKPRTLEAQLRAAALALLDPTVTKGEYVAEPILVIKQAP